MFYFFHYKINGRNISRDFEKLLISALRHHLFVLFLINKITQVEALSRSRQALYETNKLNGRFLPMLGVLLNLNVHLIPNLTKMLPPVSIVLKSHGISVFPVRLIIQINKIICTQTCDNSQIYRIICTRPCNSSQTCRIICTQTCHNSQTCRITST